MNATLPLRKKTLEAAAKRARKLGKSTQDYVESLIELDMETFDEILAPVRKDFEDMPDNERNALIERANKWARKRLKDRR